MVQQKQIIIVPSNPFGSILVGIIEILSQRKTRIFDTKFVDINGGNNFLSFFRGSYFLTVCPKLKLTKLAGYVVFSHFVKIEVSFLKLYPFILYQCVFFWFIRSKKHAVVE